MLKKYIIKYKNIPIQARASFWFLVCGILQNGLSVITLPIFTRILTAEQYGLSSTYFAWNDFLVVVCTLRLTYGVFDKGMVKYSEERDRFESALLGLSTTISIGMLCLFLVFHSQIEKIFDMSFFLCLSLFVYQIFSPALLFWTARNKYEYQYRSFSMVTIGTSICCTLMSLFFVLMLPYDRGVVKIISYQAVWCLIDVVFYFLLFFRGKKFFVKEIWIYALKFNIPLVPHFLSTIALDKVDRIMIGNFCGKSDVAVYSVSYNLGRLMVLLSSSIEATFTPWIYQKIKENNFENTKKISGAIMALFLGISVIFMLFAPELVSVFATEKYKEAVYIIPPVVASYFFIMMYGLVSKVEFYFEKTKSIAFITMLAALLDIALNYIAIPKWGYIAAGYTTLISYIFMTIGHFMLAGRIARKERIYDLIFSWAKLIGLCIVILIIIFLVNFLYNSFISRMILMLIILFFLLLLKDKIVRLFQILRR